MRSHLSHITDLSCPVAFEGHGVSGEEDSAADALGDKDHEISRDDAQSAEPVLLELPVPPASESELSSAAAAPKEVPGTDADPAHVPPVAPADGDVVDAPAAEASAAPTLVAAPEADSAAVTQPGGDEAAPNADVTPQQEESTTDSIETRTPRPLQATSSFASTVPDDDGGDNSSEAGVVKIIEGGEAQTPKELSPETETAQATQVVGGDEGDIVVQGSPGTSSSKTLASPSSTKTYADVGPVMPAAKADAKGITASANRLSISYAGGSRRLVINASVVDKLKVFRAEGRIEVLLTLEKNEDDTVQGVLVSAIHSRHSGCGPLG